jgi:hypothetical protein
MIKASIAQFLMHSPYLVQMQDQLQVSMMDFYLIEIRIKGHLNCLLFRVDLQKL